MIETELKLELAFQLIDKIGVGFMNNLSYKERGEAARLGQYPYIPVQANRLINRFIEVDKYLKSPGNKIKFLDAGCGIGIPSVLAKVLGWEPFGIDINPTILAFAKVLNWEHKDNFKVADILTYPNYKDFDIIYYYKPFNTGEGQEKFDRLIENEAKIGAVIIPVDRFDTDIFKDNKFKEFKLKTDDGIPFN